MKVFKATQTHQINTYIEDMRIFACGDLHPMFATLTGSLPVVLLLSTLATLAVSWLITRAGPVR